MLKREIKTIKTSQNEFVILKTIEKIFPAISKMPIPDKIKKVSGIVILYKSDKLATKKCMPWGYPILISEKGMCVAKLPSTRCIAV